MGGRAVPWAWRWVSISLTSMAGATALTGMLPDSAPQMPLKTSCLSLVATMRLSAACGSSYDGDAANELVGAAIDVDAIDDQRNHLKGLRRTARGDGEAGGDVFEVEAVGPALFLRLVDQHLAKLLVADGLGGADDQVALAARGHVADLGAAVAVGVGEAGDGKARHQEGLEDAVLDQVDAARGLAFVVEAVVAAEGFAVEGLQGGIVDDAHEGGKDLLAEQLGEGLAFIVAALALAFEPVAEDLVKEDGGGAAAEDGGAVVGLGDGGGAQGDRGSSPWRWSFRSSVFWSGRWASVSASKVSARKRSMPSAARVRATMTSRATWLGVATLVPSEETKYSVSVAACTVTVSKKMSGYCRKRTERSRRRLSQAALSTGKGGGGGEHGGCRLLGGEVGGAVFFLGAHLLLGLHLQEAVERLGVAAIGGEPEAALDGVAVVGKGQRDGRQGAGAMVAVGVVLFGGADAELNVGGAAAALAGEGDGSELRGQVEVVGVGDGVAEEVGLGLLGGVGIGLPPSESRAR